MPMHVSTTDGTSPATLNSLAAFDAVVMPGITASGRHYATVAAAISAGRKSIAVMPGTYAAGFTMTSGVRVVGLEIPVGTLSGSITAGAIFQGGVTISGSYCSIERLGFNAGGTVIQFGANYGQARISECAFVPTGGTAIETSGGDGILIERNWIYNTASNGIIVSPSSAADSFFGVRVIGNYISNCAGHGILAIDYGADTALSRFTDISGNTVVDCATGWGSGITVQSYQFATVIGNTVYSCGDGDTTSSGIRIETPASGRYSRVVGNVAFSNTGYGIDLGAASAAVQVIGNTAISNSTGNYRNCGSSPGYATTNTNT